MYTKLHLHWEFAEHRLPVLKNRRLKHNYRHLDN